MPDLDLLVAFPAGVPGTGDFVLYSNRPFASATSGRPPTVPALLVGEQSMANAFGWFQANQDATVKVMGWDNASQTWNVLNGNGSGTSAPTANGPANLNITLPGGPVQIVANFAVAPTTWKTGGFWRLTRN